MHTIHILALQGLLFSSALCRLHLYDATESNTHCQSNTNINNQAQTFPIKHTTIKQKYISDLCLHFRLFHPPLSCPFMKKWSQMTTMTRMHFGCLVLISTADRTQSEESYFTDVKPHSWLLVLLFVTVTLHTSGFISSTHR